MPSVIEFRTEERVPCSGKRLDLDIQLGFKPIKGPLKLVGFVNFIMGFQLSLAAGVIRTTRRSAGGWDGLYIGLRKRPG